MSSDKDIEGQISEEHLEEQSDVPVSSVDEHENLIEGDDFQESEGDDFVEEDWESYDDEYVESDGGVESARSSNFNKIVIGVTVVIALGVGILRMAGGGDQGENMGLPKMEEAKAATEVFEGQKVEFYASTKLDSKNDFGVAYGRDEDAQVYEQEGPAPLSGILNNPGAISRVHNREKISYGDNSSQKIASQTQEGQPPMPSPIGTVQVEGNASATLGLIPMPDDQKYTLSAGLPKAQEAAFENMSKGQGGSLEVSQSGNSPQDDAMVGSIRPVQSIPPNLIEKLDLVLERVGAIEVGLSQIDELQESIKSLEKRVVKVEKRSREVTLPSQPDRQSSVRRSSKPVVTALHNNEWVLKSARPGQAMVSKKGESDMLSVHVGELLAGIGKVTAIHVLDGRWIVQGTKGKVSR